MLTGLLLTVFVSALNMVNPLVSGTIVDEVIQGGKINLLIKLILIMIITTIAKGAFRYLYQVIFEHVSQNVIRTMREELYAHIQKLDFKWYDKSPSGNIMTLLTSDLDMVRHFVAWILYQIVENSMIYIFSIITLGIINWKLMLSFLIIAPFVLFILQKFKIKIMPSHLKVRDQFAKLNTRCGENIEGNRVVKAFVREDYEGQLFDQENAGYKAACVENAEIRVKYIPWVETLCGMLPVLLMLFGGYLVMTYSMTIGALVTFSGLTWAFINPIIMFGTLVDNFQRFKASASRLFELHNTKPAIINCKNPITQTEIKGNIEFRNVSFAYEESNVINRISFKVKHGMTVGILGPTGSGKTTLANLLCRYYEVNEGEIFLDGINIKDYDLQFLRKNIGITMQEVFLFSDTVEGNICFGRPDASIEEVRNAATLARVEEFINDLTEGYDTVVGERGVGLSGGQRQRIALARLFMENPKIMILDDTTSAVDNETEKRIRHSIKKQSNGHTTFIISHRLSSFESCDLILVMEDGKISQIGTHQELMAQDGYYKTVYTEQMKA